MSIRGRRRQGGFKIFLREPRDEKIILRSSQAVETENVLWKWDVGVYLDRECVEFVFAG